MVQTGGPRLIFRFFWIWVLVMSLFTEKAAAQTSASWDFLNTIALPWRCSDTEPREASYYWDSGNHWGSTDQGDYPNNGASIDFNSHESRPEQDGKDSDHDRDVLAPFAGNVTYTGNRGDGYGNKVIINAGNGWSAIIGHLDSIKVATGANVAVGAVLGRSGSTGNSSSDHIHFELRWNDHAPDKSWFRGNDHFLFGYRTQDFRSTATKFYSNNCGLGPYPITTLYTDANYSGYKVTMYGRGRFNLPEWYNGSFSSVRIQTGQFQNGPGAVTIYERENQSGGAKTYFQDDNDFSGEFYYPISGLLVNDHVRSVWVGGSVCRIGAKSSAYPQIAPSCPPGDFTGDGYVDIIDYSVLYDSFAWKGSASTIGSVNPADGNWDGNVNILDYSILYYNFGAHRLSGLTQGVGPQVTEALPAPPSGATLSYEVNGSRTAVVVTLNWQDNSENEIGFYYQYDLQDLVGAQIEEQNWAAPPPPAADSALFAASGETSSVLTVLGCEAQAHSFNISALVQAYNSEGISEAIEIAGVVNVPACRICDLPDIDCRFLPTIFR